MGFTVRLLMLIQRIWNSYCSNYRKSQKRTRDLIYKGIPPNIRTNVWPLLVGNRLQITSGLIILFWNDGNFFIYSLCRII